jgi:hypothetical protein
MDAADGLQLARVERLDAEGYARDACLVQALRQVQDERFGVGLTGELDGLAITQHAMHELDQAPAQERRRAAADIDGPHAGQLTGTAVRIDTIEYLGAVDVHRLVKRRPAQCARVEVAIGAFRFAKRNMQVECLVAH